MKIKTRAERFSRTGKRRGQRRQREGLHGSSLESSHGAIGPVGTDQAEQAVMSVLAEHSSNGSMQHHILRMQQRSLASSCGSKHSSQLITAMVCPLPPSGHKKKAAAAIVTRTQRLRFISLGSHDEICLLEPGSTGNCRSEAPRVSSRTHRTSNTHQRKTSSM